MNERTANATQFTDVSDEEYREMYQELRKELSLRKFVDYIGSAMSHATWDKYDKDPKALTRRMKQELRKAVGLSLLPLTVQEAINDVDPDASVAVLDDTDGVLNQVVIGNRDDVRWQRLLAPKRLPARRRAKRKRPTATLAQDARREAVGADWQAVIEAGLEALEKAARS